MAKNPLLDKKAPAHTIANTVKKDEQLFKCEGCAVFFRRKKQCGRCGRCTQCCECERVPGEG